MNVIEAIEITLLNDDGARGYTAAELVAAGVGEMNPVTAALSTLHNRGIVYREKSDAHRRPYRYWHTSNVVDYPSEQKPAPPALPDVLITLALGNREAVTCTLADARALHTQLSALFS